ncbi:hypothetical protein BKA64DRAFT_75211 [Cadophora sp. MPI-SDFR-AT-0126]|nr:hypothetical protein BKA64DRAFT_75211 [Leotiomycetes sp. MPI-SDFR-AT-0126]
MFILALVRRLRSFISSFVTTAHASSRRSVVRRPALLCYWQLDHGISLHLQQHLSSPLSNGEVPPDPRTKRIVIPRGKKQIDLQSCWTTASVTPCGLFTTGEETWLGLSLAAACQPAPQIFLLLVFMMLLHHSPQYGAFGYTATSATPMSIVRSDDEDTSNIKWSTLRT